MLEISLQSVEGLRGPGTSDRGAVREARDVKIVQPVPRTRALLYPPVFVSGGVHARVRAARIMPGGIFKRIFVHGV